MSASPWGLDPRVVFLNHGSFGACPTAVLQVQAALREELEREPVRFFVRELEGRLDHARAVLGAFLHADPDDLAFVPNATTGVSTVLRGLHLAPGDELLTTDHAYNACRNALEVVAAGAGARVVAVPVPFPLGSPEEVFAAVAAGAGPRTRLAVLDHVTSPTGLVFPVERMVRHLAGLGVDTLVDGAHAPGMLPLDLEAVGAAYYTGNLHKWVCAPKGAAFLHVRRDRQAGLHPLALSHGINSPRTDRARFRLEFDWTGTADPTAFLAVPEALRVVGHLAPGGWPEVRARNHALALRGRDALCEALGVPAPAPDDMLGSMAALPLPPSAEGPASPLQLSPLQDALWDGHRIEVPVFPWPEVPRRLLRISAQFYNRPVEYDALAAALPPLLSAEAARTAGAARA